MSDKAGATEFTLGLSDRLENFSYKGDLADAKLVQNIIFGTPTLGARDCFLNIKKYLKILMLRWLGIIILFVLKKYNNN